MSRSTRARQLEGMFDVPASEKARQEWRISAPLEERPWQVGLIVGPSGSGKSTIARKMFGENVDRPVAWAGASVVDDFPPGCSIEDIATVCQAVGFNTVPAWLRPYAVLSNGEKFRVDLARRMVEGGDLVVIDEFTSVVDRQVAKIGAHAVQKHIRKQPGRRFVAVTCHYDIEEWLQPDWIIEPATRSFRWRSLHRRPPVEVVVGRVPYSAWVLFAPFHYLNASLHPNAKCWGLWVDGRLAGFLGMLHRPDPRGRAASIMGGSRLVILPDFQGLGLAFALLDTVASAYSATGWRVNCYPAHPSFVRGFDRSPNWKMKHMPGRLRVAGGGDTLPGWKDKMGLRPNAIFSYVGPAMADVTLAKRMCSARSDKGLRVRKSM